MDIQDDGKILIGGIAYTLLLGDRLAILRYNSDGTLDNTFSQDGIQLIPALVANRQINDLAIFDNKIYAAILSGAVARFQISGIIVALTSPANNSVLNAPAVINITAVAINPDANITKVEFYRDSTFLSEDNTSPYSFSWSNVPIGNYTLTAKAIYDAGEPTVSQEVHVWVVKAQAPTISFESPSDNASYDGPATIPLKALAEDAHEGGAIRKVEFFNGDTLLAIVTNSPYTFSWTNVPGGNYTLTAKATDNTGLTASAVVHVSVKNEVVCTGTICATAVESGILVLTAPPGTVISSITFASYGTPGGSCGSFSIGGCHSSLSKSVVEAYALNKNSVSIPVTNQLFGDPCNGTPKRLYVEAVWKTNQSTPILINSPVNGGTYPAPATITLNANICNSAVETIDFYNGNNLILTVQAPSFSGNWVNVPIGNYSITAKSKDKNGNVIATSVAVNISVVPNKAPVVKMTNPVDGVTYTAPARIKLTATATDDGTISKVEFYNGTTLLHTEYVIPYGYWWANIAAGNYSLTAKATDNNGKVTTSDVVHISVVPNQAPVVNITSPLNGAKYTALAVIPLSADAHDPDGSIKTVSFYNGSTLIFTEQAAPFYRQWLHVPVGNYSITARATDDKGKVTVSDAVNISVVPNLPPTVLITSPANNANYNAPATIQLTADANDVDGTIKKVDFYNGNTLLFTENFLPYSRAWLNVPAGNYSITAIATDNNNKTTTSAPVAISVSAASIALARGSNVDISNRPLSLNVNPNPATDILNISIEGLQTNSKSGISILSVSGQVIKTIQSNNLSKNVKMDVSSLSAGVYFIKVINGSKILYKQFVKL